MLHWWKEDSMLVKRIAAYRPRVCLQPFTSYREIFVGNCNFFLPLAFNARGVPIGVPGKSLVLRKLESWGYHAVKTVWRYRLSRFESWVGNRYRYRSRYSKYRKIPNTEEKILKKSVNRYFNFVNTTPSWSEFTSVLAANSTRLNHFHDPSIQ